MFGALECPHTKMTKASTSPKSFEAAVAELEKIVVDMEASSLSLEQGLDRYQRGVDLLQYCRRTLDDAEQRLLRLEGDQLVQHLAAPDQTSGQS